ncbi:MAG: anti-sigma factor [Anaerolineae bacterium]
MDEQIDELLAFYALGVLTAEEQAQVEAFITSNPAAQAQLNEDRQMVAALAYGAQPVKPVPLVKQRLFERVKADTAQPQIIAPAPAGPSAWDRFLGWFRVPGVMPALAGLSLAAAVLAGVWAYSLRYELGQLQQARGNLERQLNQQNEALVALQSQIVTLQSASGQTLALQEQLTTQAEKINTQTEQLAAQSEQLSDLNQQITPLQTENANLKRDLAVQADKLVALQKAQQGQVSRESVATLEQELAAQREIVAALTKQVSQLQTFNTDVTHELSTQRAIMAEVTAPNVRAMTIAGTDSLPQAHGQLIANPGADEAVVIVSGLPPLQPGYIYQFWLVQGSQLIRAGVLNVDEAGLGVLQLSTGKTPIGSYDAMGVSIEPANINNGSANEMIMLGSFSS